MMAILDIRDSFFGDHTPSKCSDLYNYNGQWEGLMSTLSRYKWSSFHRKDLKRYLIPTWFLAKLVPFSVTLVLCDEVDDSKCLD